jgi:tRNA A-37 threonylcarbamoyl transferase component Bud32
MAGGGARGDDPGANLVTGHMRWRAMPEAAELTRALATVSVADWESVAGLSPLRHEPPILLWAKLDRPEGAYFVKVRRTKTCKRRLRSLWKPSAMRQEWRRTWRLRQRDIPTVEPVAVGERRRAGMLIENVFVSRWVPDAVTLREHLASSAQALSPEAFLAHARQLTRALGRLFGRLHAAGAIHRQYHDRNVMVREADDGALELVPLDLDHVTLLDSVGDEDREWSFYLLAYWLRRPLRTWRAGPRDVLRFLGGYLEGNPTAAPDRRTLARRLFSLLPPAPLDAKPYRRDFRPPPRG